MVLADKSKKKERRSSKEALLSADMGEENEDKEKEHIKSAPVVKRSMVAWVMGLNKPEALFLIIGSLAAFIEGGVWPVYAVVLGEITNVLNTGNDEKEVAT